MIISQNVPELTKCIHEHISTLLHNSSLLHKSSRNGYMYSGVGSQSPTLGVVASFVYFFLGLLQPSKNRQVVVVVLSIHHYPGHRGQGEDHIGGSGSREVRMGHNVLHAVCGKPNWTVTPMMQSSLSFAAVFSAPVVPQGVGK